MLDGLTAGVLLLNGHDQVRYANPQAEQLLRQHGGILRFTVREGLRAIPPGQNALLQSLILSAIATGQREACGEGSGGVIGLQQKTSQHSQAELMLFLMGLRMDFEHIGRNTWPIPGWMRSRLIATRSLRHADFVCIFKP